LEIREGPEKGSSAPTLLGLSSAPGFGSRPDCPHPVGSEYCKRIANISLEETMIRKSCLALVAIAALSCASAAQKVANDAAEADAPQIEILQISPPSGGTTYFPGPTTISLQLRVGNPSSQPIKLRRLEIYSQGFGAYSIPHTTRTFEEVIPSGEGRAVQFWVNAIARGSDLNAPVTVKASVFFDTPKGPTRQLVMQEVEYNGG
jgi:hypothetical protein